MSPNANPTFKFLALEKSRTRGRCVVVFHWKEAANAHLPETAKGGVTAAYDLDDGDFAGFIEAVRRSGGAWVPTKECPHGFLFMPWPPAAIQILQPDEPPRTLSA